MSTRAWWTAIVYLTAVAMCLRFYDLPLKPLHHDEGVNALLLSRLVRPPHTYEYDPANYHGPTLYYFGWISTALVGLSTIALRGVTAAAGLASVFLVLPLRRYIGTAGAMAAAVLLSLSPGAVYFSRYFIHETLLVCFTLAAVVALAAWWDRGRSAYLIVGATAAALMVATKETSIISATVLIGAAIGAAVVCDLHVGGWDCARARVRDTLAALRQPRILLPLAIAAVVFVAVSLLFYTSLFTYWEGALAAVKTLAIWTKTGTTTHTRPWYTYLRWLSREEMPILTLGAAGVFWALWKRENRFAVFTGLWAVGTLAAYSLIPYKTPWLALNVIAPLAIAGGHGFDALWQRRRALPKGILPIVGLVATGVTMFQSVVLNFVEYDDGRHPYVYVHTSREVFALVRDVERLEQLNPGMSIAVTSKDQFPLSWYLRDYRAGYYGRPAVTNDPLVIASEEQQPELDASLGPRYDRIGSYRLRPGVQLVLYVRRDVRRPPA